MMYKIKSEESETIGFIFGLCVGFMKAQGIQLPEMSIHLEAAYNADEWKRCDIPDRERYDLPDDLRSRNAALKKEIRKLRNMNGFTEDGINDETDE